MINTTSMSVFSFIFTNAHTIVRGKVLVGYDPAQFYFIVQLIGLDRCMSRFAPHLLIITVVCLGAMIQRIRMPLIVTETLYGNIPQWIHELFTLFEMQACLRKPTQVEKQESIYHQQRSICNCSQKVWKRSLGGPNLGNCCLLQKIMEAVVWEALKVDEEFEEESKARWEPGVERV